MNATGPRRRGGRIVTAVVPGRRETCSRCRRTVWLRSVGTVALGPAPHGSRIFQWMGRRGTTAPMLCPVSDGYPATYHKVDGEPTVIYADPDTLEVLNVPRTGSRLS